MAYKYQVSGLKVKTDQEMPFLAKGWPADSVNPDVLIETLDFSHPSRPTQVVSNSSFSFLAKEGLIFEMCNGEKISIFKDKHIADVDIAIYLLGSAWGVLCHQRGLFPLHCSSVSIENNAYAFIAESGGGKSTLAAGLSSQGFSHFCDDVAIIDLDVDQNVIAHPMPKGIKLWREATEALGLNPRALITSDSRIEKYYVDTPISSKQARLNLKCIYVLSFSPGTEEPDIKELSSRNALMSLYRNVYRVEWLNFIGNSKQVLSKAKDVADRVPIYHFTRPKDFKRFRESSSLLTDHMQTLCEDQKSDNQDRVVI